MAIEAKPPLTVVEISSGSEEEGEKVVKKEKSYGSKGLSRKGRSKKSCGNSKKIERSYSDVEIWTADEKQLNDDECFILPSDPAGEIDFRHPISDPKQDDVAVLAERGKGLCQHCIDGYPCTSELKPRWHVEIIPIQGIHAQNMPSARLLMRTAAPSNWKGQNGHCHASSEDRKWSVLRQVCLAKQRLNPSSTKTGQ